MRLIQLVILLLATSLVYSKDDEDTNEVTPAKPPINLDANLRRALLKALTELENEEKAKQQEQQISTSTIINLPHLDTSDKVVEKASASALSFFASTESPLTTTTTSTTTTTLKPFVVIQKSNGLQSKPITTIEQRHKLDPINDAEQILTSASSSFTPNNKFSFTKSESQRSVVSNGASSNALLNDIKEITKSSRQKVEITTPTVPTTSTEESQAKVEDVQFFSAPLVAAFTVHQDERGLPKSVEPIYRPKVAKLVEQKQEQQQQLALQDKQRVLEEEILRLKQQQQHQNYLIRQQQLLHEQQLQLQKQKILEEQIRLRNNQQPFVPIVNTAKTRNEFSGTNNNRIKGSIVSFQPSITLNQQQLLNSQLPTNAQILPVRAAADFRTPFNYQPFNFINQQQLPQTNNFQSFNTIVPQPELSLTAPKHNRIFRQETGTGNFFNNNYQNGFNNGFNYNFNQFQPAVQQSNRFFRSSAESTFTSPTFNFQRVQPPVVNHHLNNLLYNSGIIRGKQEEDLNIVSKVLSLNHVGGDYRFAGTNVQPQVVSAPFHNNKHV